MGMTWLANADKDTFWAHHAWTDFAALSAADKARMLVVLPVFGFADHGLNLPLDAEEIVGSAILRAAAVSAKAALPLRVMPPLRFTLAPSPSSHFGIDPETAHDLIREIATSVQAAGFSKLVFFNTSPWGDELIDAASRDTRAGLGLQTFVVNLSGLDLDFHPAATTRAQVQAVAARLLGVVASQSTRPADIHDADFRPGNYRQPAPFTPDLSLDGAALLEKSAHRLARLFAEIDARHPLGTPAAPTASPPRIPSMTAADDTAGAPLFPQAYRARYLPALTADALQSLPNKANALVIIPTGAIEQHGRHLPVGVDAILGQAWLEHALVRLPADAPVWVAPPITYAKSNEHVGFPGTVFASAKTLRRLLLALASHLHALGFRHLGLLNTHGGNSAVLVYTLREIQAATGLRAGMINTPFKPALSSQEAEYGFHAGEWETSLMLAVAEGLVRMERAVCEYPARVDDPGELRPENAPAIFSWIASDISQSGVMGDATAASLEKGRQWLEAASDALARRITELTPTLQKD